MQKFAGFTTLILFVVAVTLAAVELTIGGVSRDLLIVLMFWVVGSYMFFAGILAGRQIERNAKARDSLPKRDYYGTGWDGTPR